MDPSGAYFGWRASAIGKNFTNAKTFLEKVRGWEDGRARLRATAPPTRTPTHLLPPLPLPQRYTEDMELEDAVHTALLTLREGFEGEMTAHNIELAIVGADRKFRVLTPAEVADYLAETE